MNNGGIVLVAEDEALIRFLAVDALTEAGFDVIEAGHAAAALVHLEAGAGSIRMLFTDVHTPGTMDGCALAGHAAAHWPWIKLLVTSGKATPRQGELPVGGRFLPKPYLTGELVRHAVELLALD